MPHWPTPHGRHDINLGLERILIMLEAVGNPHLLLPPVVHVTGTNGKGSTIAYLRAIFNASGYSVHRYTSPHLINFNERIMLHDKEISDETLFLIAEKCRSAEESLPSVRCTFFENTTAMAFLAFASVPADVLLLEVGMGGRLDATNVINNPALSVITPISLDHTEFLGESLSLIAKEKAGVIKPGHTCVISWQYEEAMKELTQYCHNIGATYFACGEQWEFSIGHNGFYVTINATNTGDIVYGPYRQSLMGVHQITNAATAVVAAHVLRNTHYENITPEHMSYGLSTATWPARMEKITSGRLYDIIPSHWEMWLDGAHNPNGAEMLAASIQHMSPQMPLYIIHGRTARHNIQIFLEHFLKLNPQLVCCIKVRSELRGEDAEVIYDVAKSMGFTTSICQSVTDAVSECVEHANRIGITESGARILICGSLYLASDVFTASQ